MFREDIPRFANLFGITTNVEISDRVPLLSIFVYLYIFIKCCYRFAALGALRSIGKGISIYRYRFGTSLRLKRRNSEKDTQLTNIYDIYPHKSLVYMLLRYNYAINGQIMVRYRPKSTLFTPFSTLFTPI